MQDAFRSKLARLRREGDRLRGASGGAPGSEPDYCSVKLVFLPGIQR